jgi:integrase/recombinase XerD
VPILEGLKRKLHAIGAASKEAGLRIVGRRGACAWHREHARREAGRYQGRELARREQASELLNAPDPKTRDGLRDRAILALLIGCGLRRAEILSLEINLDTATRRTLGDTEPGWKGENGAAPFRCLSWMKVRIEERVLAAELDVLRGKLFRPRSGPRHYRAKTRGSV